MSEDRRAVPPPPREANDQIVTAAITAGWAVALLVLLLARDALPPGSRWWIWTCTTGFGLGLFGLWYVPVLKRGRTRAAQPSEPDSEYESRDSASKTVSSTETPGSSTRS